MDDHGRGGGWWSHDLVKHLLIKLYALIQDHLCYKRPILLLTLSVSSVNVWTALSKLSNTSNKYDCQSYTTYAVAFINSQILLAKTVCVSWYFLITRISSFQIYSCSASTVAVGTRSSLYMMQGFSCLLSKTISKCHMPKLVTFVCILYMLTWMSWRYIKVPPPLSFCSNVKCQNFPRLSSMLLCITCSSLLVQLKMEANGRSVIGHTHNCSFKFTQNHKWWLISKQRTAKGTVPDLYPVNFGKQWNRTN